MGDTPAAHASAVELKLRGQLIETAAYRTSRLRVTAKLLAPVAEERRRVELTLTDEGLRIDGQPWLARLP